MLQSFSAFRMILKLTFTFAMRRYAGFCSKREPALCRRCQPKFLRRAAAVYGSLVRSIRDAGEGSGSSFAIRASYSAARSSSLCSVNGSACLARRRQRSACSFKFAKSIAHQPSGCLAFPSMHLRLNGCCPVFRHRRLFPGFPHGSLPLASLSRALS
jgi:hypothetical protein